MIKDEFGFIKKNKLILLSVLVIMIIPFLYSIFFLKSVWDPYGDTQDLPVAVVNEDKAVTYNGTSMNVGQQTVDKLKKNKQLGWKFVSAKKAADGLKNNQYYTVVTIPKDFSKNAATVLSSHPKKMQLTYKTNDSLNYLSQVISGIGVDTLDKEIRANVTNAYASALFEQVKVVGKGMKTAGKGATQINNGLVTLDDGINTYTLGVSTVHDGIQTMSLKVSPLSSGVQQLTTGANQLSSGVSTYVAGTNQVASGISTLNGSVGTLQSGVSTYTGGVSQLASGLNQMGSQTGTLSSGVSQLVSGSKQVYDGTALYTSKVNQIADAVDKLNTGAAQLPAGIDQIVTGANGIDSGVTAIEAGMKATTAKSEAAAAAFAQDGVKAKKAMTDLAQAGVAAEHPAEFKELSDSVTGMGDSFTEFAEIQSESSKTLTAALTQIQNGAKAISSGASDQLKPGAQQLASGLAALNKQIVDGGLIEKGTELTAGAKQVNAGLAQLNGSVPTLIAGVSQLQSGANQLTANNASLNNGTAQLVSGVNQLNAGGQQLAANGSALTSGASQVSGGLTTMNSQLPALTSGVQQLLDGTTQLTDNNKELTGGASKLKGGSKTLAKSLVSGAKEVNGIKLTSATADMFAAPTKTKHTYYSKVSNYGHALAPYVLSLALYVGALVFNFAYPIRKVSRRDGTPTQWFFSKIAIGGIVATGMAIVEATLIMVGGLQVEHVALFYFIAWLFAMTSMYLVMFLSMWLDNPGRFIAMVLLMLQLGGSGGTFPMEITNHFYNVIHPFLPMTHSILGFREAITSGIASGTVSYAIFYMILIAVISLALLWLVMQRLQKKGLMGISQLDDNQKLQAVEK
ncbi:YhgE/Pip domain-containing protein [Lapidilactobacillus wuchangensis]|uniref:YhgE/Pip domain-containing protein n=1 Tax=Lapidilactobacillus wuchangensis TaxID=2486001 RepID=UPI000F77E740|nr:YhgE/Pip domain-containing protein [Lapidilactobacillus wuchangensis]